MSSLRIQLWSYNYDPEPTGIGPVSAVWAKAMRDREHFVEVIAAHPHYPSPEWGSSLRPYREVRDGIPVVRLPLWIGRDSGFARLRQEASYAAALSAAAPFLGRPDVIIAVSPSFPALASAMLAARARRVPWILWLQDIVTAGAATTGLLPDDHPAMRAARGLEDRAYRSASKIAVISEAFREALLANDVPSDKIERVYNPATHEMRKRQDRRYERGRITLLTMGNIGHSQGLGPLVKAFEASTAIRDRDVRLVITGHGMAADEVRAEVRSDRVEMPGLVSRERLNRELDTAALGLVSQRDDITEFNLPSKLMNFMGRGIPVLASVSPGSEVWQLVERSGAGWAVPAGDARAFERILLEALQDPAELERRGAAGHAYAEQHFTPDAVAERFETMIEQALDNRRSSR